MKQTKSVVCVFEWSDFYALVIMTFAVDWALKTIYLSCCFTMLQDVAFHGVLLLNSGVCFLEGLGCPINDSENELLLTHLVKYYYNT